MSFLSSCVRKILRPIVKIDQKLKFKKLKEKKMTGIFSDFLFDSDVR